MFLQNFSATFSDELPFLVDPSDDASNSSAHVGKVVYPSSDSSHPEGATGISEVPIPGPGDEVLDADPQTIPSVSEDDAAPSNPLKRKRTTPPIWTRRKNRNPCRCEVSFR